MSSQIKSGVQAEKFQQADSTRFLTQILLFERGLEKVGQYIMRFEKKYRTGDQVMGIVGKNLMAEVQTFMMDDVDLSCDIRFEIASQWPWAREAMRQQCYYLHSIGAISTERLLDLVEQPTESSVYRSDMENKLNAEAENKMLMGSDELPGGMPFDPLPTDDHRLHLKYHTQAANRPEYRKLFLQGREALKNLYEHMNAHHKLIPKPAPPPVSPKFNISSRDLMMDPEARQIILGIVKQAMGQVATPSNPPEEPGVGGRAAGMPQPTADMGSGGADMSTHAVPPGPEVSTGVA